MTKSGSEGRSEEQDIFHYALEAADFLADDLGIVVSGVPS